MAQNPKVYTARPKQTSDGAVSARYKQAKTEKTEKRTAAQRAADKKPADKKTSEKKIPEKKIPKEKISEKKTVEKKPAVRKTTAKKTEEKKPAARRAVMADEKTARRARSEKRREPARARRDRARAEAAMRDRRRAVSRGIDMSVTVIALLTALFLAGGLMLCAVRAEGTVDVRALKLLAVMAPATLLTALALPRFLPIEPLMMALTNFLCSVGVVILYTVSPERGVRQTNFYIMGLAAMIVISLIVSKMRRFRGLTWLAMLAGIGALVMPLVFGEWNNGAKNWVELPVLGSFQPSELVKLSLILSLAYYFSTHRTVLQMMPAILFAGACLLLLMLQFLL